MFCPSAIQRAEDLVGMAIPITPFDCAQAGAASDEAQNAAAATALASQFMYLSHYIDRSSRTRARFCRAYR
jgi:hypothetical protein